MTTVEIVTFDGFDEIDVFGPFEALAAGGLDVRIVHYQRRGPVTSQRGVRLDLEPSRALQGGVSALVVPGGGWLDGAPQGARAEADAGC